MAEEVDVWSMLPSEVVESIFSRLSVYDIVRAGCTCTRLRAFVSSHRLLPSFSVSLLLWVPFYLPSSQEVAPHGSSAWAAWVYDRTRDAWLKISLAFLQPAFLQPNWPQCAYAPVASAGGLVCFGGGRDYIVCNPITRSWRRLPALPPLTEPQNGKSYALAFDFEKDYAFGLLCNCITGTYEFFIIYYSHVRPQPKTEFGLVHYSSVVSQWRVMPPFFKHKLYNFLSNTITPCNSRLYTVWEKEGRSVVVLAHNSNGSWTEIKGPYCASSLSKVFLMDMNGSLHMVVGSDVFLEFPSVHIWELDVDSMEWMEVTRMPSSVVREFRRRVDFDELQCWGKNGVMYMKSSRFNVLMCDITDGNQWKWLKDLDLDVEFEGVIFEPSLSAVA